MTDGIEVWERIVIIMILSHGHMTTTDERTCHYLVHFCNYIQPFALLLFIDHSGTGFSTARMGIMVVFWLLKTSC